MKFGIEGLHVMTLSSCEFPENQFSESSSLGKGLKKILPYFLHFSTGLNKICYKGCPKPLDYLSVS